MSDIINSEESQNIKIKRYQFEKLVLDETSKETFDPNIFKEDSTKTEDHKNLDKPQKEQTDNSKELLEKIEVLTSEIVTLQMELEDQKKSHVQELELAKKEAYEKGKEEGIKETSETYQSENDNLKTQLIRSITLLDEKTIQIDNMFKHIEEDLVESALLIAKKVIKKEIEKDSALVTKSIATALIENIKSVTKLTLKVNPYDFKEISEHFNGDSIKIEEDEAISRGGVIILSDNTNIDGTISTRLAKAIDLIGKE
jgi:flagellar assembly protein FliH